MPEIEFRGYSGDCLIHGRLQVPAEVRLTDFLNTADVYPVHGTSLYSLDDGHNVSAGEQELAMEDVWAVEPTDTGVTPWRADLHVSTRAVQIEIEMPPYRITGFLHGVNTADPIASVHRRRRMIPLTDAVIQFKYASREMTRDSKVLIINRDRAASIRRVAYEKSKLDDIALPAVDPRAKDLTSEINFDREQTGPV